MDTYCEYLFQKKKTPKDHAIVAAVILIAILLLFFLTGIFFSIPQIVFLVPAMWFGIIWGAFILVKRKNVEYEYLLTGGDLDVDMVFAISSRKRILSIRRKDIVVMARPTSDKIPESSKNNEVTDVTSGYNPHAVYALVLNTNPSKTILFEPNERMIEQLKTKLPGKIFLD